MYRGVGRAACYVCVSSSAGIRTKNMCDDVERGQSKIKIVEKPYILTLAGRAKDNVHVVGFWFASAISA